MKKTILITGSTDGIGKLAATNLAIAGHTLYIHGRNKEKVTHTVQEIAKLANTEKVFGLVADFSNLEEVVLLADQIKKVKLVIDILINNAGVFKTAKPTNDANFDMRIAVNYFAPFVFTHALLPLLKATRSRIINLSSAAQSSVETTVLNGEHHTSEQESYAQSKLALLMWSFYLAANVSEVTTIAVNPGSLLNTKMVQQAYGQFWSSADKGAHILQELALNVDYQESSGLYFDNDKGSFSRANSDAYDREKIEKLIKNTKEIIHQYI